MATKSENSEIAVLQTQMEDVKGTLAEIKVDSQKGFDEIKAQLALMANTYLTRGEFEVYKKNLDESQAPNKKLIGDIREKVITALVWGFIAGIVLVLITYFNATVLHITPNGTTQTPSTTTSTNSTTPSGSIPSASATSTATSTPDKPAATDSQSSGGGITVPLPKL